MILYKYFPAERIDVLKAAMIRFTQMAAVNDPFDCRPRLLKPEELSPSSLPDTAHKCCLSSYVHGIQYTMLMNERNSIGLLCLTEKAENLLMWAHYAQNHEGFVIGFNTDHEFFSKTDDGTGLWKVKYSTQRPSLPKQVFEHDVKRQPTINPYGLTNAVIDRKNIFNPDSDPADYRFVKGMEWEYEQEWRLVRNICPPYHVIATVPFPIFLFPFPRTAVHSVIIGCRGFSRLNSKIREILDEEAAYANVKLFTAHTDHNEFQLNIEEFNPTDDVNDINYLLTSGILIPGDEEGHILEDLEQVVVKSAQGTNPDSVHEELQINEQIDSHADDINRYLEKVETHCVESIKEVISNEENKLSVEMAEQLSAIKSSDDGFALFFKKYAIKKSEEAIAILYKAIELSPSKADGNYNAGLALKEVGLYDCSDLFFKNAIRADPTYTAAHYSLGNYYVHFQRAWLAEACFRTALMSDPVFAQARVNLGALYQKDKRPREAEACFRKAIKDDPVLVQARQNLANILILNDNLDEALFHLLELIRLELKDAMVVALVVKLLKKVNDNPEYKDKVIISLIEIIKDSTFIETIVFGLRLAGLAGCAIPFIEKLLLMSPLAPKPNLDMASIYKKLGNVSGSQEYLNKAQSIVKTDEPKLLIYLAAIKGDLDQAFEHIQNCIVHKQVDADWLIYEPNLVWIREDPRFNIIVRQLQAGI